MQIPITCPTCGHTTRVPAKMAGKRTTCLACGATIHILGDSDEAQELDHPVPAAAEVPVPLPPEPQPFVEWPVPEAAEPILEWSLPESAEPIVELPPPQFAELNVAPPPLPATHVAEVWEDWPPREQPSRAPKTSRRKDAERLGWHAAQIGLTVAEFGSVILSFSAILMGVLFVILLFSPAVERPLLGPEILVFMFVIFAVSCLAGVAAMTIGACICYATPAKSAPRETLVIAIGCVFLDVVIGLALPFALRPQPVVRQTPYGTITESPASEPVPKPLIAVELIIATMALVGLAIYLRAVAVALDNPRIAREASVLMALIVCALVHSLYGLFMPPNPKSMSGLQMFFGALGMLVSISMPIALALVIDHAKQLVAARVHEH